MSNTAPFELGKTWYGDSETIDVSSSYANAPAPHLEGRECFHGDVTAVGTRPNTTRSADIRKTIIVRNVSGVTLQGGYPVKWSVPGKRINGYAGKSFMKVAGVIDPALGTTGVRDGDLFHLVVDGAVLMKNIFVPVTNTQDAAVGDPVYATTHADAAATTSNATFIPRFQAAALTNDLGAMCTDNANVQWIGRVARNHFGYALSAFATGTTNTDVLIQVRCDK